LTVQPSVSSTTSLSEALLGLGTAAVSDALDRLGLPGSALGIAPLAFGHRMAGPAFTVRYVPVGATKASVGDYLDDCMPGQVIVLDNAGRLDCTVWGDILTSIAHARGIAGTAVDGVCRDVARPIELGYPLYSRGRFMRTGKDRVQVADVGGAVGLGGTQVRPNDLVVGDDDGVVVVPAERAEEVAATAREIADAEQGIIAAVMAGESLAAARERFGYHRLQRHAEPSGSATAPEQRGP
jgi:regulator of RNase E activity RraA